MSQHADATRGASSGYHRWARRGGACALLAIGVTFLVLAKAWRGVEASMSARVIAHVTGQTTIASPSRHLLILYRNSVVHSVFVLTGECSVAYLLAALFIGAAPLMLLRQLAPWRTLTAIAVAMAILTLVNVVRLSAIGAAVSEWGLHSGMEIAHTYFGSLLTIVGTCGAGIGFAVVLLGRRSTRGGAHRSPVSG